MYQKIEGKYTQEGREDIFLAYKHSSISDIPPPTKAYLRLFIYEERHSFSSQKYISKLAHSSQERQHG